MEVNIDHYFSQMMLTIREARRIKRSKDPDTRKHSEKWETLWAEQTAEREAWLVKRLSVPDDAGAAIYKSLHQLLDEVIMGLQLPATGQPITEKEQLAGAKFYFANLYAAYVTCLTSNGQQFIPIKPLRISGLQDHVLPIINLIKQSLSAVKFTSKGDALAFFNLIVLNKEMAKQWASLMKFG